MTKLDEFLPTRGALLPYYRDTDGIRYLVQIPSDPKYGGTQWQLGKGKIDPGETAVQAAVREGFEELGIKYTNFKEEPKLFGIFKKVAVYIVEVIDCTDLVTPGFETLKVSWLTNDEFQQVGRDIHRYIIDSVEKSLTVDNKSETSV